MVFKPEDEQETGLNTLLEEQQDPLSPNYQKWLSPEEFADRFGLSPNDVSEIVSWLHSHGFTVDEVARTRRWVSFTGTAEQVESAFQTRIHEYSVEGENFYANSIDPAVPPAFANVILGFRSLNNFRMKPRPNLRRVDAAARPQFTSSVTGYHYLTPADFATIYDLGPLYAAGFDGAGQKIAVMGQTDIQLSDIRAFRSASGLPANDSQVVFVPGSGNPGIVGGDVSEASLDIEWAGAIARNAQIVFVVSRNGVFDSLQYTIDQNLAPVVSISYGSCEQNFTSNQIAQMPRESRLWRLVETQAQLIARRQGAQLRLADWPSIFQPAFRLLRDWAVPNSAKQIILRGQRRMIRVTVPLFPTFRKLRGTIRQPQESSAQEAAGAASIFRSRPGKRLPVFQTITLVMCPTSR